MRSLAAVLLLVLAAPAAAATIHGSRGTPLLVGTAGPDTIVTGPGDHAVQAAWGGLDRVVCGDGVDVVSADLGDRLAGGCAVVARRLSVDASTDPRSQHETGVEPDDFAWGSTVVAAYQLGRLESGAASNIGYAVSYDAGRTWKRGVLPSLTQDSTPPGPERAASDPTVAYDAAHGVWLIGALTLEQGTSHVLVSRSTDGLHWSAPVTAGTGPLLDKEWLACDNGATSPFRGHCYALYSDDAKNVTVGQTSTDGGATWSAPVRAGAILVGTQPAIQPNGTLVTIAGNYANELGLSGSIEGFRSTDGGATFTHVFVAQLHSARTGEMRAIPLPSVAADANGTIYAVWDDCRFRPRCSQNDLVLSTSTDGVTWTAPARIPLVPASSSENLFVPGLGVDPAQAGRLALVYAYFLPGSCARGACLLGVALTQSRDAGATWTAPQQLDAQPMLQTWLASAEGGRMVGDYFSAAFAGGRVVPVFALAAPPLGRHLREAIFAASLPALG